MGEMLTSLLNIFNSLLDEATEQPPATAAEPSWFQKYGLYIILGVLVVAIVVWFIFSGRKNKQKQKEYVEQLDAIGPGNKVKTAGGICGIVVEVCDDNTVIIETGSEASGKSYVKMDKELIAQTDAKGPTQIAREEAEARRKAEKEAKASESQNAGEVKEEPAKEEKPEEPAEEPQKEEPEKTEPAENKTEEKKD